LEFEIVGMTADAVHESLHAPALPVLSFPFADIYKSNPLDDAFLSIRADRVSASTLSPAITRAIAARDPDLSLTFQSMPEVVSGSIAQDRALAILIGFFGALALVLAALGLYGVTSYAVSRRKGEIAIRMALGADRRSVIGLVLSRVAFLVGGGIVAGAAGSLWMSRFAAPLLYDLEPRDPFTLVVSMLTLAAVGAFAGWLPAHRASRIDPALS
jgi:ABC-type antimicrobial peptide transport system permease subunit